MSIEVVDSFDGPTERAAIVAMIRKASEATPSDAYGEFLSGALVLLADAIERGIQHHRQIVEQEYQAARKRIRGMVPKPTPQETIWITRNSTFGVPEESVSVWYARPTRYTDAMGVYWSAGDRDDIDRKEVRLISSASKLYRTMPDDDRQCVRIGEDR